MCLVCDFTLLYKERDSLQNAHTYPQNNRECVFQHFLAVNKDDLISAIIFAN